MWQHLKDLQNATPSATNLLTDFEFMNNPILWQKLLLQIPDVFTHVAASGWVNSFCVDAIHIAWILVTSSPGPSPPRRGLVHTALARKFHCIFRKMLHALPCLMWKIILRIQSFLWNRSKQWSNLQNPAGILLFRRGRIIFSNIQSNRKVTNRFTI